MIRRVYLISSFAIAVLLAGLGVANLWHYVGYRGLVSHEHWIRAELDDGNAIIGHAHVADKKYPQTVKRASLGLFGGLGYASGTWVGNWRYVGLILPLWSMVAVLLVYPAVAFIRGPLCRRRRGQRYECVNCGYDRTGNTSGVCPECGNSLL